MIFLLISLIKTVLSVPTLNLLPQDLRSFEKMLHLTTPHAIREFRTQILLLLLPPPPQNGHYQRFVKLLLKRIRWTNWMTSREPKPRQLQFQTADGLFLLVASIVTKDDPVLAETHSKLLKEIYRGVFICNPYLLLLLLSLRGQGLPLPSKFVSEAAEAVKTKSGHFGLGPGLFIRGFRGNGMMSVGVLTSWK